MSFAAFPFRTCQPTLPIAAVCETHHLKEKTHCPTGIAIPRKNLCGRSRGRAGQAVAVSRAPAGTSPGRRANRFAITLRVKHSTAGTAHVTESRRGDVPVQQSTVRDFSARDYPSTILGFSLALRAFLVLAQRPTVRLEEQVVRVAFLVQSSHHQSDHPLIHIRPQADYSLHLLGCQKFADARPYRIRRRLRLSTRGGEPNSMKEMSTPLTTTAFGQFQLRASRVALAVDERYASPRGGS